jgi:hypothetical protein
MDVRLHIPDEPVEQLARWRTRLAHGETLDDVLAGPDGVEAWYWDRWRAIERSGIGRGRFSLIAGRHRREFGLWLRGERRHEAVASTLAGRVARSACPSVRTNAEPPLSRLVELNRPTVGATA